MPKIIPLCENIPSSIVLESQYFSIDVFYVRLLESKKPFGPIYMLSRYHYGIFYQKSNKGLLYYF